MINESKSGFDFKQEVRGSHNNQLDITLKLYKGDIMVSFVDFSVYKSIVLIEYIKSLVKLQGYASKLISELHERYGYQNIVWGEMTRSGSKLKDVMDAKYGKRRVGEERFTKEFIPYLVGKYNKSGGTSKLVKFMQDYYTHGDMVLDKWNATIRNLNQDDVNNVMELLKWVLGSVVYDNNPRMEIPNYLMDFARSLSGKSLEWFLK